MFAKGDYLVAVKGVARFLNEGETIKIIDVDENDMISFAFGDDFMHMGLMTLDECMEFFKRVESETKAPTVTIEQIDEIIENSEIIIQTDFDKCTIVACRLPNGFVIVESSACVCPENYDEQVGVDICLNKIKDKLWELEGYRLQEEIYRKSMTNCSENCDDDDCDCDCDEDCCSSYGYNNCSECDESCNGCGEHDDCDWDCDLDCDDCPLQ